MTNALGRIAVYFFYLIRQTYLCTQDSESPSGSFHLQNSLRVRDEMARSLSLIVVSDVSMSLREFLLRTVLYLKLFLFSDSSTGRGAVLSYSQTQSGLQAKQS